MKFVLILIVAWWLHVAAQIMGNIDSGYGLPPDGSRSLLEPMLTYDQRNFTGNSQDIYPLWLSVKKLLIWDFSGISKWIKPICKTHKNVAMTWATCLRNYSYIF